MTAADVVSELGRLSLHSRRLVNDPRLTTTIQDLNSDFEESIKPHLAGGALLPRNETNALNLALNANRAGVVVLHGDAGKGKSGVLYELTKSLLAQHIPFLAIRLDRKRPLGSARSFGISLGLPESPSRCLHELTSGGPCVLILDQLDALRWTSEDSAAGLDICKQIAREILSLRSLGSGISLVLSCRTFDLEHDPQIRDWLKPSPAAHFERIQVEVLTQAAVSALVEANNLSCVTLTPRELQLLQTIGNLTMWIELAKSSHDLPTFGSTTGLLRAYWNNRRRCIQGSGVSASALKAGLDALVEYAEHHATPSAPVRLIEHDAKLTTELQSWGVVKISHNTVSFAHQSQLDFLIADRALASLDGGPSAILKWLATGSQALYRREQLRQLLVLLSDEDQVRFCDAIRAILNCSGTRFHLKQVTLEVLGQIDVNAATMAVVTEFLADGSWKEHFISEVVATNGQCFRHLFSSGELQRWLESGNERDERTSLWLIRHYRDSCEDILLASCTALVSLGIDWATKVLGVLNHEVHRDSRSQFRLRLKCVQRGAEETYIGWKELIKEHPNRALKLFAAVVKAAFEVPGLRSVRTRNYGSREDPALRHITQTARSSPRLSTRLLLPCFAKYVRRRAANIKRHLRAGDHRYSARRKAQQVPRSLAATLNAALCRLAKVHPVEFLEAAKTLEQLPGSCNRRILVESYGCLPREFADISIKWLLQDKRRLRSGASRRKPRWLSARRLIRNMSPYCSESLFRELEDALVHHIDPDELRHSKYYLRYSRDGQFFNNIGRSQLHLLPALCPKRRSDATTSQIGVLRRKFKSNGKALFVNRGALGGTVRSAISSRSINTMSNKAWLGVICNAGIPRERSERSHKYLPEGVIETSVDQFASDLRVAAERAPGRFAKLAMELPDDAPPSYIAAILSGLQCDKAPGVMSEDEKPEWRPAAAPEIDAVLGRPLKLDNADLARQLCWLILRQGDLTVSEKILRDVAYCARHADPRPDELHVNCHTRARDGSVHDLETNALNCVRGCAALAIASILYEHPSLLERLRQCIENLLRDPHPAVRAAAVGISLPAWNIDKDLAIEWFQIATVGDPRIAACREALRLYNYALPKYADAILPIVREMVLSAKADVAEAGAYQAAARWLFHGLFEAEVNECKLGSAHQRRGVAHAFANIAHQQRSLSESAEALLRFANDEDKDVRLQVTILFRYDDFFELHGAREFLSAYVSTTAFQQDPSSVIQCLEGHKGALAEYAESLLVVIRSLMHAWQNSENRSARFDWVATRQVLPLSLRLYEQTTDPDVRKLCLDMWDEMLRLRICSGSELSKALTT